MDARRIINETLILCEGCIALVENADIGFKQGQEHDNEQPLGITLR